MLNVVIIASTGGSVFNALTNVDFFRQRISCLISDRQCGAVDVALARSIPVKIFETKSGLDFSNYLLQEYQNQPPNLFISFYTRLFKGGFLDFAKYKLVNLHPSILPACPGMDGFGDTIRFGAKFIGATIHYVDEGVDTGYPIIQSSVPYNPGLSIEANRHKIFIQQCKMLLQLIKWLEDDKIILNDKSQPVVRHAKYDISEFSPNLDFYEAIKFKI